ncbi:MAG: hypothetical protein L6R35_007183 [Caloplaca aegaea]|nr:MAG: hypothetical protein L6R35_007183 [Caloplaca aegaea]
MHYQQLPSLLRLLLLSTLLLPSFAVEDDEGVDRFNDRYIDPPTVTEATITLNYLTASNTPANLDVPFNKLHQTTDLQATTIAVGEAKVLGQNDVGVPVELVGQEIWCHCFADKAGRQILAISFTFGSGMAIGSGPESIGSIYCSDLRGLQKYMVKVAADKVLGGPDVKKGLDKVQGGSPKKTRRFFSS